ncbi:3-keto-5-aminohexanoate cleavage protein [Rhodospirillaceae bacterium SYSU D60014]|uniref:3-keto-5-aminohexanoate cleavage protein n=1 Tax=Virgifigura deserti TaxID=2268457 RepID=UPI000E664767
MTSADQPEAEAPLILAVAPNGARKTKADHPALPMTADEIAETAVACQAAGAAMIHLHVRDREGRHSLDPDIYRETIDAIRRRLGDGLIVQVTTEAVGRYGPAEQMAAVRAIRPEAVSLAIKEIIPDAAAEPVATDFLAWLARERIAPQYILYSAEELRRFEDLRRRGIVPGERPFVLFVLGRYTPGQRSTPGDLLPFLNPLPVDIVWAVCAFGARETACALTAAGLGGHARVGFENNMKLADGSIASDNAALVAQLAAGTAVLGRPLADAETARAMLSDRA